MSPSVLSDRERHIRAICYVVVSLALALAGYLLMGFSEPRTIGFAVLAYVLLNVLSLRAMFARPKDEPPSRPDSPRP